MHDTVHSKCLHILYFDNVPILYQYVSTNQNLHRLPLLVVVLVET
ncbi:unnamed protein product [Brugia timori]|uniref:Uncharacterized protein n=1 Tax=Brugia timori TaxID=42155 RepID=A0A3P7ZL98_9BILA|nr:unnamed protein product [Brugia timori]